jgi:hypothetical protein
VPPDDARALAIALTVLRDPKMRCDLARRAHEHALRAFTPDAVASALSDAADQTLRT